MHRFLGTGRNDHGGYEFDSDPPSGYDSTTRSLPPGGAEERHAAQQALSGVMRLEDGAMSLTALRL